MRLSLPAAAKRQFHRWNPHRRSHLIAPLIVVAFAGIGVYLLVSGHALSPYASSESEAGTRNAQASVVSDSTASGGKFVQFGSPSGWQATYYNNETLTPPSVLTQAQPAINFNYQTATSPAPNVNATSWSADYKTTVNFATAGTYTFTASVDDGIRIFVDGTNVMDHWVPEAVTTYTSLPITLTATNHQIEVQYFQDQFADILNVSWALNSGGGGGGTFLRPFTPDSLWYQTVASEMARSPGSCYGSGAGGCGSSPNITEPTGGGCFSSAGDCIFADYLWLFQDNPAKGGPQTFINTGNSWTTDACSRTTGSNSPFNVYLDPTANNGLSGDPTTGVPYDGGQELVNSEWAILNTSGVWHNGDQFAWYPNGGSGSCSTNPTGFIIGPDIPNNSRGTLGGHGASGLNAVGPALRPGELEGSSPITHAIGITAPMGAYGLQSGGFNGGAGYTTPAVSPDSDFDKCGSSTNAYCGSAFWMGSLLAIRPQDCAAAKAAMSTQQGKNLADAFCTYGAYVTENAASAPAYTIWMLQIDAAAVNSSGIHTTAVKNDVGKLLTYLYVVLNNNPPL